MFPVSDQIRLQWERRSELYGQSLRGVLFKGLPEVMNEHIHLWQKRAVLRIMKGAPHRRVLDVGCGYGRMAAVVLEEYPDTEIVGIDISKNYVRLFRKNTGMQAVITGVEDLPDSLGDFDSILCISVLMYLERDNLKRAASNLLRHLGKEGRLIVIEPDSSGKCFQTFFGLWKILLPLTVRKEMDKTRGRFFRRREIRELFFCEGGEVTEEERMPATSLLFVPLAIMGHLLPRKIMRKILGAILFFDNLLGRTSLPSIFVAYSIGVSKDSPPSTKRTGAVQGD